MSVYSLADIKSVNTIQENIDLVNVETHLVQLSILKVNIQTGENNIFRKYMKFDDYLAKTHVLGLQYKTNLFVYYIKGCILGNVEKIAREDILKFNTLEDLLENFWIIVLR